MRAPPLSTRWPPATRTKPRAPAGSAVSADRSVSPTPPSSPPSGNGNQVARVGSGAEPEAEGGGEDDEDEEDGRGDAGRVARQAVSGSARRGARTKARRMSLG